MFYRAEKAKFPFGNVAHFCTRKKWENEIICIHNTISLDYFSGYDRRLPGFPRYSVLGTDDSGEFSLQITNASLADDAIFECQVGPSISNRPIRASARVNVLRKFLDILKLSKNKSNHSTSKTAKKNVNKYIIGTKKFFLQISLNYGLEMPFFQLILAD